MQTTKKAEVLLDACEAAFKAFIERDTPETWAALCVPMGIGAFDRGAASGAAPITIRFVASSACTAAEGSLRGEGSSKRMAASGAARLTMTHEQELDLLDRIAAERAAGNGQAVEGAGVAQPIKTASR
jgi:hypothetical protein